MKWLRVSVLGRKAFFVCLQTMMVVGFGGLNGLLGARWAGGPELLGPVARTPWGALLFQVFPFWAAQVYWTGCTAVYAMGLLYVVLC
jgi:hypothetical protein